MKNILQDENIIPVSVLLNCAINEYLENDIAQTKKLKKVSLIKKIWNERAIKKLLNQLINDLEPYKNELQIAFRSSTFLNSYVMEEVKYIITKFMQELDKRKLFFDRPFLKFFIEQGYLSVAEEFITRSKKEDSQLEFEEVFQALRNVWIMNSLQIFWGLPLKMTPSIYAYSMLYPYTDNFLDNSEISKDEKIIFNKRLSKVLNGEKLTPTNFIEDRVFSLVGQIESQYCRDTYPEIFNSLMLIQDAQNESMKQDMDEVLTCEKILPISFFKGGTSVLADAFLIKGNLNMTEMQFAFNYGSFLQLLDDLQDVVADKKDNHQTLFSIINDNESIDYKVRKLISYIFKVNSKDKYDTQTMTLMKEVICSCTLIMIMDAAGRNPKLISRELYNELNSYSNVRLPFYKEFEEKIRSFVTIDIRNKAINLF